MWPSHVLLKVQGRIKTPGGIGDIWSIGIRYAAKVLDGSLAPIPRQLTDTELEQFISHVLPPLKTWFNNAAIFYMCDVESVSANQLKHGPRGNPVYDRDTAHTRYTPFTPEITAPGLIAGGSPTGEVTYLHPPQISCVHSLMTDYDRGFAHRGRIYSPMPYTDLDSSYALPASKRVDYATRFATFLNSTNTLLLEGGDPVVNLHAAIISSSFRVGELPGNGTIRKVTSVQVGSMLDTQRSRRNAFTETYASAPVTP